MLAGRSHGGSHVGRRGGASGASAAEREVAAAAGGAGEIAFHGSRAPGVAGAIFASRCRDQRAELDAAAGSVYARPPRSFSGSARGSHSSTVSRGALSAAAVPAGVEREGRNSGRGAERSRSFSAGVCGSTCFAADSAQTSFRSTFRASTNRGVGSYLDHLSGRRVVILKPFPSYGFRPHASARVCGRRGCLIFH